MNAPVRATAGGTTRKPPCAELRRRCSRRSAAAPCRRSAVAPPSHHAVVVRAEVQQHRFLDPLVRDPGAVDLLGDAQAAGVQAGDDLVERLRQIGRSTVAGVMSARRSNAASMSDSSVSGVSQRAVWSVISDRTRRCAARPRRSPSVPARARCGRSRVPGLIAVGVAREILPGSTVTCVAANRSRANASSSPPGTRAQR